MTDEQAAAPFEWVLDEDKGGVTLVLQGTKVHWATRDLEIATEWLGHLREQLLPPVPASEHLSAELMPVDTVRVIPIGPRPPVEIGGRIVFRSAQFGWFEYPASPAGCTALLRALVDKP